MVALLWYNYCPDDTSGATTEVTVTFHRGSYATSTESPGQRLVSKTSIPPPDEAESEKVVINPWLWLVPEDHRCPVAKRHHGRLPRRPARCRDPPKWSYSPV